MNFRMFFDLKFFKFIMVGIINTLAGSTIMFTLYNAAHMSYWLSSACNYVFTSILSFFLNKYFTFSVRDWSFRMVISFAATIALSYIIAYGISKPAVNYLFQNNPQNIRENTALFAGMCLFTFLNYTGQRFVVFKLRSKNEKPNYA